MTGWLDLAVGDVVPALWLPERKAEEEPTPANGAAASWYLVCTAPGCEAEVVERLKEAGFLAYFPWEERIIRLRGRHGYGRRCKKSKRPAFPTYVFVGMRGLRWDLLREVAGKRVRSVVARGNAPLRIEWETVEALQVAEDMGVFDKAAQQPFTLEIRDQVRLTYGMLEGYEGVVMALPKRPGDEVSVQMSFGVVKVPLDAIEPV